MRSWKRDWEEAAGVIDGDVARFAVAIEEGRQK
jgi:hypothetical protein